MPDYERIIDEFSVAAADTPEKKAYAKGFIAGKRYARVELIRMIVFLAALAGVLFIVMTL